MARAALSFTSRHVLVVSLSQVIVWRMREYLCLIVVTFYQLNLESRYHQGFVLIGSFNSFLLTCIGVSLFFFYSAFSFFSGINYFTYQYNHLNYHFWVYISVVCGFLRQEKLEKKRLTLTSGFKVKKKMK